MAKHCISTIEHNGEAVIAALHGSLTVANAPDLRQGLMEALKEHKPKTLALNLTEVDFIDSSALGVFVEVRREAATHGGSVAMTNLNDDIRGLMRIMHLDSVFTFLDDVSEVSAPGTPGS
ncbi:STAS domain-containing protein [Phycisphaeraceae bacterium D3-23]